MAQEVLGHWMSGSGPKDPAFQDLGASMLGVGLSIIRTDPPHGFSKDQNPLSGPFPPRLLPAAVKKHRS